MKFRIFAAAVFAALLSLMTSPSALAQRDLPSEVYVDGGQFHVQGIAYDAVKDCMYMSFTSAFYKVDMQGNIIASVTGINGHLGAMTFDAEGRKVYASLEFKDDSIGANISKGLGEKSYSREESSFCIACIDVDKVDRMDVPQAEAITLTRVEEAIADYQAKVNVGGQTLDHRYACSGIDGITIGPDFGHKAGAAVRERFLYVAYGVYGDTTRVDNDYNIILKYRLADLRKPVAKYFVFCGNTTWGVQNMAYDASTDKLFLAVYKGKKSQYPNYALYALDMSQKPFRAALQGVEYQKGKVHQLRLSPDGLRDEATGITGWDFKWGSTGFCPLGDGRYYISQNGKTKAADGSRSNYCRATLYHWTGNPASPFEK